MDLALLEPCKLDNGSSRFDTPHMDFGKVNLKILSKIGTGNVILVWRYLKGRNVVLVVNVMLLDVYLMVVKDDNLV
jgi:hypothetical protein